ncbi:MAG: hypothetical protein A3I66_23385 [Burkholderiales bacterium RIFCSPLOWO2_02_FULL_57_36]|nr:MAG: hypothetical protein A3I66_23385 [Burkholderiales bacterium RIFCSPLOWO2_02_FULL_57_36]
MNTTVQSNLQSKSQAGLVTRLRPGRVYRREDLSAWSGSVDRDLQQLVGGGVLQKLAQGLYYAPRQSTFGTMPPEDEEVVGAFLRDSDFLIFSPNAYNSLGVGTTQLYNTTWVYNHKRHGRFQLGNRSYEFRSKPKFPRAVTPEFLLVDMLNNLDMLAEDKDPLLERVRSRFAEMDPKRLKKAMADYGSVATRKRTRDWLRG